MGDHADFWVAVATISPIALLTNLVTVGAVMVRKDALRRDPDEHTFTSLLRGWHLRFVGLNLAACLALIYLALASLWSGNDAAPGWLTISLLLAMLVELCFLPICTESILASARRKGLDEKLGLDDQEVSA